MFYVWSKFWFYINKKVIEWIRNTIWLSDNITIISFKNILLTFWFTSTNNTIYCFPRLSDVIFCFFNFFYDNILAYTSELNC